jgi:hypothetical protein
VRQDFTLASRAGGGGEEEEGEEEVCHLYNTSINSNRHSASSISGTRGLIIISKHSCKILQFFILISGQGVVSLYIILNLYEYMGCRSKMPQP